ncbi:helix-turn-helix domain-containing protein [Alcanivorax borkumensis]|jgi:transcriptional regulator with XRE-family HTH domain|uniref:helix-turn-helix domain-containing protein n=1 Tax=Alcanivorax borkumensis TaxID=59754 RepID=UPI003EE9CA76
MERLVLNRKKLGLAIRHRRVQLRLSQEELADLSGLHRTYVGSVERGERNVAIDNMLNIAVALGCKLSELLVSAEEMDDF